MKTPLWLSSLSIIMVLGMFSKRCHAQANYTVHEWGTFTSVQGGDGELLEWRPLQTSELPGFVHDWTKPGLNRFPTGIGKGGLITLQRMETPVIYFYSDEKMTVDVSVDFPKGVITEWYPQASQIGPSLPMATNPPITPTTLTNSRAVWKNLEIAPPENLLKRGQLLPQDKSGSHYFAARGTGANLVQMELPGETNSPVEAEKFIFYRGAGSFKTPLRVSVNADDDVAVENSGVEKLSHLFLVSIHNGRGAFAHMDELPPGNPVSWLNLNALSAENWQHLPLTQFQNAIGAQMESALTSEGLFADEARAMINTWRDSWLAEEGERVLYILPRTWTDEILPMTLNPQPQNLARVMVGRAEIITPAAEMNLLQDLSKAQNGDANSRHHTIVELKAFGRFAGPALSLVSLHGASTNTMNLGYQLLSEAVRSKN
jgi:hypothetical protein